jgi:hypothetical protein
MSAATLPLTDDIVTFRNQIGCAQKFKSGNALRKSVMNALISI